MTLYLVADGTRGCNGLTLFEEAGIRIRQEGGNGARAGFSARSQIEDIELQSRESEERELKETRQI